VSLITWKKRNPNKNKLLIVPGAPSTLGPWVVSPTFRPSLTPLGWAERRNDVMTLICWTRAHITLTLIVIDMQLSLIIMMSPVVIIVFRKYGETDGELCIIALITYHVIGSLWCQGEYIRGLIVSEWSSSFSDNSGSFFLQTLCPTNKKYVSAGEDKIR